MDATKGKNRGRETEVKMAAMATHIHFVSLSQPARRISLELLPFGLQQPSDLIRSEGLLPPHPIQAFSILVRGFLHAGLAKAIHAFCQMDDYGYAPDHIAFSVVIAILYKKMHAVESQEFFDSPKDRFLHSMLT